MIIAIHGLAQSGKDTLGRAINYYYSKAHEVYSIKTWEELSKGSTVLGGFKVRKFAYKVKTIAASILGMSDVTFMHLWERNLYNFRDSLNTGNIKNTNGDLLTNREILIGIGDGLRHTLGPDVWVHNLMRSYCESINNWMITDLRYYNEANELRNNYKAKLFKIVRDSCQRIDAESERGLIEWESNNKWDYIFYNNSSVEDLYKSVCKYNEKEGI